MNDKKTKRYRIVRINGVEKRKIKNKKQLEEILTKIQKNNDDSTKPYLLGNIKIDREKETITFTKYKKITVPNRLEELDQFTSSVESEFELKLLYNLRLHDDLPLVIAYRSNKEIKTLKIIYKKQKQYLETDYIKSRLKKYGRYTSLINIILTNQLIKSHARLSLSNLEQLNELIESIKQNNPVDIDITPLINFYEAFITDNKKHKENYLNFRIISKILMDFEEEPEEEQKQIKGQTMIKEYILQELRELYEELKIEVSENGYTKKLEKNLMK